MTTSKITSDYESLQVIKGNHKLAHSQNTSDYKTNFNPGNNDLFKVAKNDIIIEKPLRWFENQTDF